MDTIPINLNNETLLTPICKRNTFVSCFILQALYIHVFWCLAKLEQDFLQNK